MTVSDEDIGDQPWGFWVIIRNAASAKWAIKMSGVVTFILGAGMLVFSVISVLHRIGAKLSLETFILGWQNAGLFTYAVLAVGAFLVIAGLRIRAGQTFWLFATTPIVIANHALLIGNGLHTASLISVLHLILLISGFRGWWWLRSHSKAQ